MRAGASPNQNGIVGGWPLRVLDEHLAGLDAADPPRGVAELEDVAGGAVDREVLVDLADLGLLGPLHDRVVVVVGDRAAAT